MNDVQEDRSRRTFCPPSNPSYLRSLVVVGTKSFFAKKIKLSQSSRRSANFSMITLSMWPKILANLLTITKMIFSDHPSITKILEILPSVSPIRNLLLSQ